MKEMIIALTLYIIIVLGFTYLAIGDEKMSLERFNAGEVWIEVNGKMYPCSEPVEWIRKACRDSGYDYD